MKTYNVFTIFVLALSLLMSSCTNDIIEDASSESQEVILTEKMTFNAILTPFDAKKGNARATSLTWKEGDTIYLLFYLSDGSTTTGTAVYKSEQWEVNYDKSPSRDETLACKAYYFDGSVSVSASDIGISPLAGIYGDDAGTYIRPTNGQLTVTCNLKPLTSRIRFKGTPGTEFSLEGMDCGSNFNRTTATLTKRNRAVTIKIADDGYSPYIYGNFAASGDNTLSVSYGVYDFVADCSSEASSMLRTGESGWMDLPTETSRRGWATNKSRETFTVGGVTFKMIKVEHGTFQMGSESGGNNEKPVHSVTISKDYYIGETEVTQALWKAVTGQSLTSGGTSWSSTCGLGDNYPAYYISYEDVQEFITKLNQKTGRKFRMPTEAEWEYAAKGGNKSKGYTYSGSNTIGDVAWYTVNSYDKGSSSPDYGTHPVKTKSPNELGIYDMSGNVYEWCSDWYGAYSSSAVTDPTGPSTQGEYFGRVYRGGSWDDDASDCRSANREQTYYTSRRSPDLGFRLAL